MHFTQLIGYAFVHFLLVGVVFVSVRVYTVELQYSTINLKWEGNVIKEKLDRFFIIVN